MKSAETLEPFKTHCATIHVGRRLTEKLQTDELPHGDRKSALLGMKDAKRARNLSSVDVYAEMEKKKKKDCRWEDVVGYHKRGLEDCLLGLRLHVDTEFVGFMRVGAFAS